VADVDTAFVEQFFDLQQRKWKPNIHHRRQTDNLGRRFELLEGIFHQETLRNSHSHLKPDFPDNTD
jgi:hypothetical protein